MRTTPTKEYVHEAQYVAEVDVTLIEEDHVWAPYFSIEMFESSRQSVARCRRAISPRQPSSPRFTS